MLLLHHHHYYHTIRRVKQVAFAALFHSTQRTVLPITTKSTTTALVKLPNIMAKTTTTTRGGGRRNNTATKGATQASGPFKKKSSHRHTTTTKHYKRQNVPTGRQQKQSPTKQQSKNSRKYDKHGTTTTTTIKQERVVVNDSTAAAPKPERIIAKHEIAKLPPIVWNGKTTVINQRHEMQAAVRELLQCDVLGFDTETKPVFRRGEYEPPALVQIANQECVFIFQILGGGLDILLPLLQAAHIVKAGVAVQGDIAALQKVLPFTPGGFVELSKRTKKLGYGNGGLRGLAAMMLGGRLSKGAQMSNWAKPTLDERQISYAATDAWVGRELYLRVLEEEKCARKAIAQNA